MLTKQKQALLGAALAGATTLTLAAELEQVIVSASRIEQTEAPLNSLSVIGEQAIDRVSHTHINELLNRAPGVWVSRGNGQEHLTAIRSAVLTGGGSCGAFYMAQDGIPLRAPGFCNVNQLFDANSEQAARVEVIRGPGTAVHGSNALNGVINVITRAPTEEASTRISAEGGPHDYSRLKLEHSQGNETHRVGFYANGAHDGGYKDNSGFDQQKMTLRYDYSGSVWSSQNVLTATNLNQETAGYVSGKDAYKNEELKKINNNPEAYRDVKSARFHSRWEREGSQNTLFVVTPYLRYNEMAFLQHFLPGDPLEENGHTSAGVQTAFFSNQGKHTRIHSGFDLDYTDAYLSETQTNPTFRSFPKGKHYDYEVESINVAWFVGGEWNPKPEREVNAGLRYEIQRYDYDNLMIDGNFDENGNACPISPCRFSRPADDNDSFYDWSAYFGARENLNDTVSAVFHASHGFKAPQATELYRLQSTQSEANLESEQVTNIELGLRAQTARVSAGLTAYRLMKKDIILQNASDENFNGGETLRRGLEAEISLKVTHALNLNFTGSYSKTEYKNDVLGPGTKGNEVDTAPRQLASAQLLWQPFSATTTELEWVHVGDYYIEENNLFKYSGHNLLNLRLTQGLTKGLELSLRVTNLTDEDYAERADYGGFPVDYRYFIGEPRSAYVGITAEF